MPAIPTPPPDASGGYLIMEYTQGTDTHRMRLHVAPFNFPAATQFNYNPVVGAGVEVNVTDTFDAFGAVFKAWIKTTDSLNLLSVFQIVGGVPVERFGFAQPPPIAGTDVAALPVNQGRAGYVSFNFKSVLGGRAKVVIIGGANAGAVAENPKLSFAGAGGITGAIISYLVSTNSAARCHDGNKFAAVGDVSYGISEKLRRRYGFS